MGILNRYVFRQTAGALLGILVSLTGVTWIAVGLRQLELMTSQGQDALRFLAMTSLAIPSMLALIAPIALLIAAIHVLNRLASDSELIVMSAGGMPAWALLKPLGTLAIVVAAGVTVVNHAIGPWSQQTLREYVTLVRTDLMGQVIQPWRFTTPEKKLTVHIRDRAPNGELLGLLMHDARDAKQTVSYLAERGRIFRHGDVAYLRMENGHIVRRLQTAQTPEIIVFDQYMVDLNQVEQRADQANVLRPRERYTDELWSPPESDPIYRQWPGRIGSELHERFSSPLYAFAFVLIAIAFLGQAQTTRQNRMKAVVGAFATAVGCRILGIAAANAVAIRPSAAFMLYLVPVGAALAALVAIRWQSYPRPPTRLSLATGRLSRDLAGRIAALWPRRPALAHARRAGG
jgi:lipopolysaccharide export system permease protein